MREAPYLPHRYSQFHSGAPTATHSFTAGHPILKCQYRTTVFPFSRFPYRVEMSPDEMSPDVEESVLRNGNKMQICDILLYFVSKTIYKMSIQKLCEFHRFFQTTGSGLGRVPCPPHPSKMADVTVDRTLPHLFAEVCRTSEKS